MKFTIPMTILAKGYVTVEADSPQDLFEKLADDEFVATLDYPEELEYVDDSYGVEYDELLRMFPEE